MMARRRFASLLFAIASLLLPLSASAITIDVNGLLTGPGFNSGDPPLGFFTTTISNRWLQESAVLVVGPENGVSPNEGDGMLRIQNTVLVTSQVRQVISVSVLPGDVAIFRMAFNSPVAGAIGGAILSAYGAGTVGAGAPLLGQGLSGATLLDANPLTWETLSVGSFGLPVGTTQLEAQVFFTNGTIPQNGYVDAVPEPSTLLLTALGLFGVAVRYRRQRGTGLG